MDLNEFPYQLGRNPMPQMSGAVTYSWADFFRYGLGGLGDEVIVDNTPDFQRGRVWTLEQQRKYVEQAILGYPVPRLIIYNKSTTVDNTRVFTLVDGLQRMTAVQQFVSGRFDVFDGFYYAELKSRWNHWNGAHFFIQFCELHNRADLLRFYIDLNTGGTPHTPEDIQRVQRLLEGLE